MLTFQTSKLSRNQACMVVMTLDVHRVNPGPNTAQSIDISVEKSGLDPRLEKKAAHPFSFQFVVIACK
ncbi:hypothetical protein JTE90_011867 [Oedothorax gibbosus]|uniref:Uncharacterized protein n=1 Tax=Oedothorax gibbosus TaxID=931172 RepID=A0AAV6V530_9ARAC|nr:hypothetical protein JTE90_011867 [Oedothorax gibbosus]